MSNQLFFLIFALCAAGQVIAQTPDFALFAKEYIRLEEALPQQQPTSARPAGNRTTSKVELPGNSQQSDFA